MVMLERKIVGVYFQLVEENSEGIKLITMLEPKGHITREIVIYRKYLQRITPIMT